ncbi:DISARM system phospholipase D-like protein DrmC [Chlorogloea sp. CCALA 695]|uniref:DISARM system phospholipase D-like protein DrmC n=1 Tax=Chlorogloea sp. CCALA 695 TaxID=2107693 RepID=UPI0018EC3753|nr:DISARM system phospholipase D-like protein DrmC [Chlorogloea sp. CCALA 695]
MVSAIASYIPAALSQEMLEKLNCLSAEGLSCKHIAYILRLLAAEPTVSQEMSDRINLVWSGPETIGSQSRDTSIVVCELFSAAKKSVLVSSFAVDRGEKAQKLFQVLAERMDANPQLEVQMFLNIHRPHGSQVVDLILLREFANTFRQEIWLGKRLPQVFYDPRSLSINTQQKACLHAKCIVVDNQHSFITSANFTEAAHERNIEVGVLLTDPVIAQSLLMQFNSLLTQNILRLVPGL